MYLMFLIYVLCKMLLIYDVIFIGFVVFLKIIKIEFLFDFFILILYMFVLMLLSVEVINIFFLNYVFFNY